LYLPACCFTSAAGYVLLFAPRSLGWRDEMRLVLRHFGADNAVAFALVNLLGFFPAILGCIAWPLLCSAKHKVIFQGVSL
jgi:hypothetical protein